MTKPKITVVGSSNTDLVVKAPKLPVPGETILGSEFIKAPGGKGANQAVAAARLGAEVTLVAKLGMDDFGDEALKNFKRDGIIVDFIFRDKDSPSGVALIFVDDEGENMIVAAQGANAKFSGSDIDKALSAIENADAVVLQLETTMEAVERSAEIANKKGVPVILNPAPGQNLSEGLIQKITYLTPNETETEILTDIKVNDQNSAKRAGNKLLDMGVKNIIITMGKAGAMLINTEESYLVPAFNVKAVDATAAGDAFNGGFAFALASGMYIKEGIRFANAVAGLAVTKMGAQPSMPVIGEVDEFLGKN
ncbi:ribokinase [Candidatus Poribacteria bacterium]|nr:ribokinase [Candidatus Poribacteria bacterium]